MFMCHKVERTIKHVYLTHCLPLSLLLSYFLQLYLYFRLSFYISPM